MWLSGHLYTQVPTFSRAYTTVACTSDKMSLKESGEKSGVRVEADILREKCSYQGRTEVRGSSESGSDMEVSLEETWESRTG